MTTNYIDAIDEMFTLFLEKWNSETEAIVEYVPEIRWQGCEKGKVDLSKFWVRVSQQTVDEGQKTLANITKRYETAGLIFVQLYAPKDVESMDKLKQLAVVARNAFRGQKTAGGVTFLNARINELEPDNGNQRINVVSEYEYEEIT